MNLVKNTSKYKKIIKYTYFGVLAIAICWSEWHYATLHNLMVNKPNQITNNDITELHFWGNAAKSWSVLGFVSMFINYLSMRKKSGSKFTTMVVNYLNIGKKQSCE